MWHKIVFVGRLGKDVELRYSPDGKAVASFPVAVDDGFGDNKKTIWLRVSVWEKQAESCNQYLHKGSLVLVEGRLTPDPKTGGPRIFKRQDGTEGASFEVSASTVRFIGGKDAAQPEAQRQAVGNQDDEDFPF